MGKKSIQYALNQLVLVPLICLGIITLVISIPVIYSAIVSETEEGLKNLSHALLEKCNIIGDGDYHLEDNVLYKGDVSFGNDCSIVDSVKEVSGIDATIFWNDTRMLTTIKLKNGERAVGTKASEQVIDRVLKSGREYFASNVPVNEEYYYGYYIPMKNSDDTIVGMVFVGKSRERIIGSIFHMIGQVFIAVAVVMIAAVGISLRYTSGIVKSLSQTREFLESVAQGDLECQIDEKLLARRDEFGEMGRFSEMLQKSILKLIGTDPLTGLYNRRSCNEALERAINEYNRGGKKYTVAIGDIDDFKKLNDTYGHLAGDEVLKVLSKLLQSNIQEKGMVARWGGEEFLILYREENPVQEIEALLEKIRGMQITYKGQSINMTMTFGISSCEKNDTTETIIKRADEKLYRGKENGKNQVVA